MSVRRRKLKHGYVWQVQWYVNGKQHSKHFKLKVDADEWDSYTRLYSRRGGGSLLPSQDRRFADFVEQFQAGRVGLQTTTLRRQKGIIDNHFLPHLGDLKLTEVKYATVKDLVMTWSGQGLAPRTVRQHLQVLGQIFSEAVNQELVLKNPVDGVRSPRANPVKKRILIVRESQSLLKSCNETYKPLIHTALATGMRFNELERLEWRDVDFTKMEIFVRKSKTAAGVRCISINKADINILQAHRKRCSATQNTNDRVFLSPEGRPVNYGNFTKRYFLPLLKQLGLDDVRFHDLRRTHATMLVLAGLDPITITYRMGHSHFSTTMQYYTAADELKKREAAAVSNKYTTTALRQRPLKPQLKKATIATVSATKPLTRQKQLLRV